MLGFLKPKEKVAVLHPGEMGAAVAAALKAAGHQVYWVSEGRRVESRTRAEAAGLADAGTLAQACASCAAIYSVCPPAGAEPLADQVLATGFQGLYVDANPLAPDKKRRMSARFLAAGAAFADGGIVGGPQFQLKKTRMYLSGPGAEKAAAFLNGSDLRTVLVGPDAGRASAVKLCYAAYTKGTGALLCGIMGAAESMGIREELLGCWGEDSAETPKQYASRVRTIVRKSWRFAGEMDEIASAFRDAGMPAGFFEAASDVFARTAAFKDAPPDQPPPLEDVLASLRAPKD